MPEDPRDRITGAMRNATSPAAPAASPGHVTVIGDGSVVASGDGNVININQVVRPKIEVKTGDGVIDAKQKAELTARLNQWLTARNAIRKKKLTIAAAWAAFNAAMKVNSYAELRPDQMPVALRWISRQRAILSSMESAPVKIPDFRTSMISAIKARAKQLGDLNYYRPHIAVTYGLTSLTQMSDRQLQELRAWIMGQKRG